MRSTSGFVLTKWWWRDFSLFPSVSDWSYDPQVELAGIEYHVGARILSSHIPLGRCPVVGEGGTFLVPIPGDEEKEGGILLHHNVTNMVLNLLGEGGLATPSNISVGSLNLVDLHEVGGTDWSLVNQSGKTYYVLVGNNKNHLSWEQFLTNVTAASVCWRTPVQVQLKPVSQSPWQNTSTCVALVWCPACAKSKLGVDPPGCCGRGNWNQ